VFTNKLSQVLELSQPEYPKMDTKNLPTLLIAIKHQNIIGRDLFLKGYISTYWSHTFEDLRQQCEPHKISNWEVKLLGAAITLHKGIWDARNKHIHGSTAKESKIAQRIKIQEEVIRLYPHPPRLASRYQPIRKISLHNCLQKSTTHLRHWLSRINHQTGVFDLIRIKNRERQRSILSYCQNQNDDSKKMQKYPP